MVLQDGNIVTGYDDIQLWGHVTGELIRTITFDVKLKDKDTRESIYYLVGLDNENLVSGGSNCSIIMWDIATGTVIRVFGGDIIDGILTVDDDLHLDSVDCLVILECGNIVSGSDDGLIKIWNLSTGLLCRTLVGNAGFILCLVVLKGGLIASGSSENTIQIWEPTTGVLVRKIQGKTKGFINHLAVIQDGRIVSGDSKGLIKVWSPPTEP